MALVRLFAAARTAAGTARDQVPGGTVAEVIDGTVARYGPDYAAVLASCKVWLNGVEVPGDTPVGDDDEIGVLPPVSGGAA
ncbi:MAG: MoaD/ThiS family protein [Acidimicrobiales bacterium]|nr:MoaD/ThiS family protein [Acidimicrobiales bacterium]